jgi:hypothetical protein
MSNINNYIKKIGLNKQLAILQSFDVGQSVWRVGDHISRVWPPSYSERPEPDEVLGKSHKGDDEVVSTCAYNQEETGSGHRGG